MVITILPMIIIDTNTKTVKNYKTDKERSIYPREYPVMVNIDGKICIIGIYMMIKNIVYVVMIQKD